METQPRDGTEEQASGENPEDVAILYSWANLQGAKYRDFSASRREYRAQIRYRAAEQLRLAALKAQWEAESEAAKAEVEAEAAKAEAERAEARLYRSHDPHSSAPVDAANQEQVERMRESSLRAAAQQARRAAAERDEATRRAEAAALADTIARREELEIEEARASGARQAAQYRESGVRSRQIKSAQPEPDVPGRISDPYLPQTIAEGEYFELPGTPAEDLMPDRLEQQREYIERNTGVELAPFRSPTFDSTVKSRSGAFEPGEGSGYLSPAVGSAAAEEAPRAAPARSYPRVATDSVAEELSSYSEQHRKPYGSYDADWNRRSAADTKPGSEQTMERGSSQRTQSGIPSMPYSEYQKAVGASGQAVRAEVVSRIPESPSEAASPLPAVMEDSSASVSAVPHLSGHEPVAESGLNPVSDRSRSLLGDRWAQERIDQANDPGRIAAANSPAHPPVQSPAQRFSETGPAWLYPRQTATADASVAQGGKQADPGQIKPNSDLESTLQQSRERVAARWFALKGAFATAGPQHTNEPHLPRERSGHTPILVVYSLAGGVGKTSLVATLGRALSSLGERVLLADTTSHGLLPFYFGASELHPGVVRTFSPPEGSADAAIQLVSYNAEPRGEGEQTAAVDELLGHSRGLNRVLIDLNGGSGWLASRLARLKPTVLVPLAPDMNSVIGLQMLEKRFSLMLDDQGHPLKPFYLLSQFDASLPLHLDVREVLRQQLGERLLPFVVRRAASVSEALAEGMTIIDYDPESAVARDYLDVAKWIRSVSAPAAAVFRNLRWSER